MTKQEALKIVLDCAKLYQQNLENKNLLILYQDENKVIDKVEITFYSRNFLHFTGFKLSSNIKSSNQFYKMCLSNKLSLSDFEISPNGITQLKLQILPQIMQIHKIAKTIGDYDNSRILLCTDKIIGNQILCMGIVKNVQEYYVPNTILKENVNNIVNNKHNILAMYIKTIREKEYKEQTFKCKNITQDKINKYLLNMKNNDIVQ